MELKTKNYKRLKPSKHKICQKFSMIHCQKYLPPIEIEYIDFYHTSNQYNEVLAKLLKLIPYSCLHL